MIRHCVYRFYDANYVLLYIDRTANVGQRLQGHQSQTRWFSDVDTITVEHCESAKHADEVERSAILAEAPLHNTRHQSIPALVRQREHRAAIAEKTRASLLISASAPGFCDWCLEELDDDDTERSYCCVDHAEKAMAFIKSGTSFS